MSMDYAWDLIEPAELAIYIRRFGVFAVPCIRNRQRRIEAALAWKPKEKPAPESIPECVTRELDRREMCGVVCETTGQYFRSYRLAGIAVGKSGRGIHNAVKRGSTTREGLRWRRATREEWIKSSACLPVSASGAFGAREASAHNPPCPDLARVA